MNHTKKKLSKFIRLRWAARVIMLIGFITSIGANALHAAGNAVSVAIEVAPPVILFLSFELVSRIPMREGANWFMKLLRPVPTAVISAIAAYLSYRNQHSMIFKFSGGDIHAARLLPIAIDGLLIVASVSIIELNARIEILEAHELGASIKIEKSITPPTPIKPAKTTAKERIVEIITQAPTLKVADVAKAAGTSVNYVYSVQKELGKMANLETAGQPA